MKNEIIKDFKKANEHLTKLAFGSCVSFMELGFAFAQLAKETGKFLKEHPECLLPTYHWDFDER
jgi:hypothetical protein